MKNKHLLAIVVGLCGLNVLLGIVVLSVENANEERLDNLTGEFRDDRQHTQDTDAELAADVGRLQAELRDANSSIEALQSQLTGTQTQLATAQEELARLRRLEWLDPLAEEPPWAEAILQLNDRIDELEKKLPQEPKPNDPDTPPSDP